MSPEGRDEEYPTEATDYVMFHRYRISYDDDAQGYKGLNVLNSKVLTDDNKERVYQQCQRAYQLHIHHHIVKLIWV